MNKAELLKIAKPILFNTPMVQAILDGRKTATRRIVKFKGNKNPMWTGYVKDGLNLYNGKNEVCNEKPRYKVDDILYVRETWHKYTKRIGKGDSCKLEQFYGYKASIANSEDSREKWHPSIHMPKEAARIFLRVTDVRVERLQDIITGDYKTPLNINAEGLYEPCCRCTHVNGDCKDFIKDDNCRLLNAFTELWNGTIKKANLDRYGWDANPFVWVIEFERLEG